MVELMKKSKKAKKSETSVEAEPVALPENDESEELTSKREKKAEKAAKKAKKVKKALAEVGSDEDMDGGRDEEAPAGEENVGDAAAAAEPTAAIAETDGAEPKRKRKRKHKSKAAAIDEADEADDDEAAGTAAPPTEDCELASGNTVYAEGISYSASEDDLREAFAVHGTVTSIRMPRYQDSGRPRGFAHIVYETAKQAAAALKAMNGHQLMGRYLKVAPPMVPRAVTAAAEAPARPRPPGCRTVFVRNLPYDASEDSIRACFSVCGRVNDVRLALWNHTKLQKGFGYVEFAKEAAAEVAVKKQRELKVGGRQVVVDYDGSAPKRSFKLQDGQHWTKTSVGKKHKTDNLKDAPPAKGPAL